MIYTEKPKKKVNPKTPLLGGFFHVWVLWVGFFGLGFFVPTLEVYQILWRRISSCEEGKVIQGLLGRISRGKKGKGK